MLRRADRPLTTSEHRDIVARIYIGERDQWNGRPLHDAIVELLRERKMAGATVVRGSAGFGAKITVERVEAVAYRSGR